MTKHTIASVLRHSTAKVQTRYRGKYASRVRATWTRHKERTMCIESNDHRILEMSYAEASAYDAPRFNCLDWEDCDIEVMAQFVADYRNAMQVGRKAGPIARIVSAAASMALSVRDDPSLADMESMYSQVISFALSEADDSTALSYVRADRAIAAQRADERVTIGQIYNLTGIDIYRASSPTSCRRAYARAVATVACYAGRQLLRKVASSLSTCATSDFDSTARTLCRLLARSGYDVSA